MHRRKDTLFDSIESGLTIGFGLFGLLIIGLLVYGCFAEGKWPFGVLIITILICWIFRDARPWPAKTEPPQNKPSKPDNPQDDESDIPPHARILREVMARKENK